MRYALLIYSEPGARDHPRPVRDDVFDDWVAYTRAMKDAGVVLGGEQLEPLDTATTVRVNAGERLLTDGPFAETKEHLLGLYVLDVPDLDVALDWAARMPVMRYGTVEVRPAATGTDWQAVLE